MKTTLVVIGVVVVGALGYLIWANTSSQYPSVTQTQTAQNPNSPSGSVAVSFTDQTAQIANVNEVKMNVGKVELYSQAQGWVEVGHNAVQYKLLDLKAKGQSQIYATAQVPVDTYTRARVTVNGVVVTTKTKGDVTATMPNNQIDLSNTVKVNDGQTSSIHLDVLADQSLHSSAHGDFVFAPVVKVESRSNVSFNTASDNSVTIDGGDVNSTATQGMDVDGSVKADFKIDPKVKLDISGGVVQVLGGSSSDASTNAAGTVTTTTTSTTTTTGTRGLMRIKGAVNPTVNGTVNGAINY